jgi:glutamine amidotransferase
VIAIIDYGMGNSTSVLKAFHKIGVNAFVTANSSDLAESTKIVLPGVGAYGDGVKNLKKRGFFSTILDEVEKGKPFLGICLGMQLIGKSSEESDGVQGLSLIDFDVIKFQNKDIKIPHVGWNSLKQTKQSKLFDGIPNEADFYFVHSYHVKETDKSIGNTLHGETFTSVIEKDNVFGTQFHPEKSQKYGLGILRNFSRL